MNRIKRFVDAQEGATGYETALEEMRNGRKQSHWMWYIFPQIKGLGKSYVSNYYGIDSLYEACQYIQHEVLGARLREITREVLKHYVNGIYYVMCSDVDVLKFHSCMTLFEIVTHGGCFKDALDTFFNGERDEKTLAIVQTEREFFHKQSAFIRHGLSQYLDKGFFESSSFESEQIPRNRHLPTLVDLFLKGERMNDMVHHYLYHTDFSDYRLDEVESTLSSYCHELFWGLLFSSDIETKDTLGPQLKDWENKIVDVESAAKTFDWMLDVMKEGMASHLEKYAKNTLIKDVPA